VKRFVTLTSAICALTIVIGGLALPASAQPYHHRMHVAYADMNSNSNYPACRIGWWQTLAYGHVRPRWAAWCR